MHEINDIVESHKPLVFGLDEANFKNEHDIVNVKIPGYTLHLDPCFKNPHLGVARFLVYTHSILRVKRRDDLEDNGVAAILQDWKESYDEILENSEIKEILSGLYVDDGRALHRKLFLGERYDHDKRKFIHDKETEEQDIKENRTREDVTRKEIITAMNSVNDDLDFTIELSKDFEDHRLPTLSFSLWEGEKGLEHSYFEKSMRNQTLVVERTAMGRHSIMNIMSNELIRRLEVLDENLEKKEILSVIDKYK